MKNKKRKLFINLIAVSAIMFSSNFVCAHTNYFSSEIFGTVTNIMTNQPVAEATVQLFTQSGKLVKADVTDEFGNYELNLITAGTYEIVVSHLLYELEKKDVTVFTDQTKKLDLLMVAKDAIIIDGPTIVAKKYEEKEILFEIDQLSGGRVSKNEIKELPVRNTNEIVAITAGVYQEDVGSGFQVRGSRPGKTLLIIDGVKVDDLNGLPASAIESLQTITGGLPARYGDTTAGAVIVTTRSYFTE